MKRIILTGGGSAGHVTPNLALIPELTNLGWVIDYIGTHAGIERELVSGIVPYHAISAGKLRRYLDPKNFTDPFRVLKGIGDAYRILRRVRPHLVFSKGGFVSLPVSVAAKFLRIPVILHESDFTPGLANRLALPFSSHLCLTFPESLEYVPESKATVTGNPIRKHLLIGNKTAGRELCKFSRPKPVILIIGGSLGAVRINEVVRQGLKDLVESFSIVHLCGKGNLDGDLKTEGYCQFEYVTKELPDLLALADVVISRAGANALFELLALKKPHILIPLPAGASRGDQVLNAASFARQGYSAVVEEKDLTSEGLVQKVKEVFANQEIYIQAMEKSQVKDAAAEIIKVINRFAPG